MRGLRHLPIRTRRLLLGGFLVYLFGILGFQGSSHGHESAPTDPQSISQNPGQSVPQPDPHTDPRSHQECQLCQIMAQAFLAPEPLVCHESPLVPARLVEAVWAPILSERFQPFSSRAPPAV